jgi:hypothetical protein
MVPQRHTITMALSSQRLTLLLIIIIRAHGSGLTLVINRRRVFSNGRNSTRYSARVRLIRLKVGAGGCGGRGLVAGPDLTAMGIESFFVCSLLILLGLGESGKIENRS